MNKPKIAIFALGGTILMTGDQHTGVKPGLSPHELIKSIPEIEGLVDIEVYQSAQKASGALTIDDITRLSVSIREAIDKGIDGVVVIQGTDTIEETSFALDLMLQRNCPVIMSGAMRNPSMSGGDGPANLVTAILAATQTQLTDFGVLVAFDNELHLACHVSKQDSVKGDAFKSPLCGPVGRIVENRLILFSGPLSNEASDNNMFEILDSPTQAVALLTVSLNDDGRFVTEASSLGYKAIVLGAMGAGHVPPEMVDRLEEAASNIPVIFCSRSPGGQVCQQTYGYMGSEMDLLNRGLISGGWLSPLKARIITMLILAKGLGSNEISAALRKYDGGFK